jgi:hypothetical protein
MGKLIESTFVTLDRVIGSPERWGSPYWNDRSGRERANPASPDRARTLQNGGWDFGVWDASGEPLASIACASSPGRASRRWSEKGSREARQRGSRRGAERYSAACQCCPAQTRQGS